LDKRIDQKRESLWFHTYFILYLKKKKKKKEKETCILVILVYRTCENRVDENPAFSLYSLLYLYELKKKRRKPEQRFAINFIQTSSVQDGVAVIKWSVWFVWWVAWRFLITEMVSPRGDDIARETVLKVFKMCNMCLSVTWEKESKREIKREREREEEEEEEEEKVSKENLWLR